MQQELSAFAARNSPVYPPGFTVGMHLTPIDDLHLSPPGESPMSPRGDKTLLAALVAIAALVIASASFNFVALMTARAAQRAIETGVRKAMGALRSQLIIQFLGEAVIYVALAMALAVALAKGALPHVNSVLKQKIAFSLLGDPALLGALLLNYRRVGLMAGAYPAFVLSAFRPAAVLKGTLVQGATAGISSPRASRSAVRHHDRPGHYSCNDLAPDAVLTQEPTSSGRFQHPSYRQRLRPFRPSVSRTR